jgi:BlaI family penicillinase repressor
MLTGCEVLMGSKREYSEQKLSRRERQIMDIVYRSGEVSVTDLLEALPDPPTSGAARRMLNILEEKGFLKARMDGPRKLFSPTVKTDEARDYTMKRLVETFFGGSAVKAMASFLENSLDELSGEEIDVLSRLIESAKKEGR